MPSKKWIVQRAIGYAVVAAILVAMMLIKDQPGQRTMRFTCDQMRPLVTGLTTLCAFSSWHWVAGTAEETWQFHRFFALAFLLTIMAGLGVHVYFGSLSKEQGVYVLMAIAAGAVIGIVRVFNAISRDGIIES